MSYLTLGLSAAFLTALLVPWLVRLSRRRDLPRRSHLVGRPNFAPRRVPPVGGIALAVALGIAGGTAALLPVGASARPAAGLTPLLAGAALVFLVGACDDRRPIKPWAKLLGQCAAASASHALGLRLAFLPDGGFNYAATLFCLVGGANALNLIDGLDGLAGSVAALAAGALFLMAHDAANLEAAAFSAALAGAALSFTWLNLPPARAYLGDGGSNLIGFGLAGTALLMSGGPHGFAGFSSAIVVLGIPIVETATTIVRRLAHGTSPFRGDLDHIHHRLLRQGWSFGGILGLYAGITFSVAVLILLGRAGGLARETEAWVAWSALTAVLAGGVLYRLSRPAMVRLVALSNRRHGS